MLTPLLNPELDTQRDRDLDLEDLPTSEELPCSDDTPVDNEGQNTIPNGLLAILKQIWAGNQNWFFGVDMGIYDRAAQKRRAPKVIPDGFLSLGVQRHKRQGLGRLSYVLREENEIPPIFVLEYVSKTYGGEYDKKMLAYAELGVLYYILYNPEHSKRDLHDPFEVYKLMEGQYRRQSGEPVWMPEIGLGIGRVQRELEGIEQEWLAWHNAEGNPYPLPEEMIHKFRQRAEQERLRAERAELRAEQAELRAEEERQRAEEERQRAEEERQRAEEERQRAEEERQRAEEERLERLRILEEQQQLLEKLRQKGIDLDSL
jgi:Uma2 family endonuclease